VLQRSRIDQMLSVKDDCPMLVCSDGVGRMYSADPYNYVRVQGAGITTSALAAKLDQRGSIDMVCAGIVT